jgi:cell wall-associated NlpC family hydrolase
MPNRRAPVLAYVLAVPVLVAVYAGTFGTRIWAALRPAVATFLGATVIGTVYADEALKRAPATPLRAAAVLALAVALVGPGMAPAPAFASSDPAEDVIAAAREYLGKNFQIGAEGPKVFDCSGLVYRAFADAGELPRIGGMRLRAAGYMRWFIARGHFSKHIEDARRGDLIVWNMGDHIGIYLGEGKAISALINPWGVMVHSVGGIHQDADYVLHVNWNNGDGDPGPGDDPPPTDDPPPGGDDPGNGGPGPGNGDNPGSGPAATPDPGPEATPDPGPPPTDDPGPGPEATPDPGSGDNPGDNPGTNPETPPDDGLTGTAGDNSGSNNNAVGANANSYGPAPEDTSSTPPADPPATANQPDSNNPGALNAYSAGTLNMRVSADPEARIVGWVYRGQTFRIIGNGNSPGGWLWYQIQTASGKQGWVFAHWVRQL